MCIIYFIILKSWMHDKTAQSKNLKAVAATFFLHKLIRTMFVLNNGIDIILLVVLGWFIFLYF